MTDRAELLEATLDSLPEGLALLGDDRHVVFWNQAAQATTGYSALDVIGRPVPEALKPLLESSMLAWGTAQETSHEDGRGFVAHARHKLGQDLSAMAHMLVLRDGLGQRIGTAVLFHSAECLDASPETGEDAEAEPSQADLKERLASLFEDFSKGGAAFGVLWIAVDQARDLRRTHGAGACEALSKKVEHALARGLRPGEHLGRWGEDEFLVISHERTLAMLAAHGQALAGLARTADFHWWGDRVSLTVSIGAAHAESSYTPADLLERAQASMLISHQAGGNQITPAPEDHSCSPS